MPSELEYRFSREALPENKIKDIAQTKEFQEWKKNYQASTFEKTKDSLNRLATGAGLNAIDALLTPNKITSEADKLSNMPEFLSVKKRKKSKLEDIFEAEHARSSEAVKQRNEMEASLPAGYAPSTTPETITQMAASVPIMRYGSMPFTNRLLGEGGRILSKEGMKATGKDAVRNAGIFGGTEYALWNMYGVPEEEARTNAMFAASLGLIGSPLLSAGKGWAKSSMDKEHQFMGEQAGGGTPSKETQKLFQQQQERERIAKEREAYKGKVTNLDEVVKEPTEIDVGINIIKNKLDRLESDKYRVIVEENPETFTGMSKQEAYKMLDSNPEVAKMLSDEIEANLFKQLDEYDLAKYGDDRIEVGAKSDITNEPEIKAQEDAFKAEQLAYKQKIAKETQKNELEAKVKAEIDKRIYKPEKELEELNRAYDEYNRVMKDTTSSKEEIDIVTAELERAFKRTQPYKTSIESGVDEAIGFQKEIAETVSKKDLDIPVPPKVDTVKKGSMQWKENQKKLEAQYAINKVRQDETRGKWEDRLGKKNKVRFVDSFNDGRLASNKNGEISIRRGLTKEEVVDYITKDTGSNAGKQKLEVTRIMKEKYGIDLPDIISKMNDREAIEFLIKHEQAHNKQREHFKKQGKKLEDVYFEEGKGLFGKNALDIEAKANILALESAGKIKLNRRPKKDTSKKKLEEKSTENKSKTPTKPKEVEEIEKLEERVEGLRERAKKLFAGTKTNWKASYRNDGVYGTYQEIHRMTRDALNEAARAGRNATDFIEKAMKSSGFKKGDGFDKGFYKSILSTDYQSIKEFKTQRQASKFLQDNKELYLEVKKYVDQTAKGIRDKGHMNNVNFSNSGYMITIRAGIDAKYADTIDKLISVKAMSNEDWAFIEKYKGTTAFKEMLSMSYELKQQSKKLFENNRHAEMKGYQSELYDSIYRYDMVDGRFVKKIDTEVGMVQGGLPQRLDNSRTGEIIQYPKYVQKMDNDLKEMYAMSNNLGVVFDMYGNPKALRKVASEKERLEIGKSNLASDVLPLTYENSTRKLLQIDGVINKIRNTEDNNLFSSTEKEGMELLSEEELKGIPTELHEKVRYVNKDFKQMLLGNKQIQVASGDMTKILEQVLKDSVTHFKENVVLKNPASWLNNMGYNYFVNLQNGISPVKTTQMMKRGLREKKAAENMMKAVTALELSGKAGSPQHKALLKKLEDNLYYKLDREGMAVTVMSNIIDSPIASKRFSDKAMKQMLANLVGKDKADKISNVVANMYLSPQSKLGQHAMNMFGSIDAMGRYTLALDAIEKGASHADAIKKANSIYGDLDMIAPKWSQAIQQYGFIPFSNWYFRMSGGLARNILDNKMKAIGVAALLYGISEVSDKRTDSMNPLKSLVATPSEMLQMTPYLNVDNYAKNVVTPSVYKKTARAVETGDPVSVVLSREF